MAETRFPQVWMFAARWSGKSRFRKLSELCHFRAVQPQARAFVSAAGARRPLSPGDLSYF